MTSTRTWHVSLMVEILVCVRTSDNCPENAIRELASNSVSLFPTGQEDVSLKVGNIEVIDVVEIEEIGG